MESDNTYAIYQLKGGDELHGYASNPINGRRTPLIGPITRLFIQVRSQKEVPFLSSWMNCIGNSIWIVLLILRSQPVRFGCDRHPQNGALSTHYVDSIGFVELPGFCSA